MAINVGTLEAILRLRDELTPGVAASARSLETLGNKISAVGGNIRSVGLGLTAAITLPLAAMAVGAVATAVSFESAFAGVVKTVDDATDSFGNLTARGLELQGGFRQLALEIPTGADELARIGELAGQLGVKSGDILGFTRVIADLGVTTNLTIEAAATQLARFANIMDNEAGPGFASLGNVIVELGNNMATTEAEIVSMALRLAASGKLAGLTEGEIFALSASLSSVGVQAQVGGTSVSKAIQKMAAAAAQGGDALELFAATAGVSAQTFKQEFEVNAAGAIDRFIQGLGSMEGGAAAAFARLQELELGDQRLMRALLSLASAGDIFTEALGFQSKALAEGNALAKEAETRYKTTASQFKILGNNVAEVARTIGTAFLPAINTMITAAQNLLPTLQRWAQRFADLPSGIQLTVLAVVGMVAAIGPLLLIVGQLAISIGALGPIFASTRIAMALFGNSMPILSVRLAAMDGGLKGVLTLLRGTFVTGFTGATSTVVKLGKSFFSFGKLARGAFLPLTAIVVALDFAIRKLSGGTGSFGSVLRDVATVVKAGLIDTISVAVGWVRDLTLGLATGLVNALQAVLGWLKATIPGFEAMARGIAFVLDFTKITVTEGVAFWKKHADAIRNAGTTTKTEAAVMASALAAFDQRLSGLQMIRTVQELDAVMLQFGNSGELTTAAMTAFAVEAQRLQAAGESLTPGLENIVAVYGELEESAIAVATVTAKLSDEAKGLAAEIGGANLTQAVEDLEKAWASLDPAIQQTERAMARAGDEALALRDDGATLSDELNALADQTITTADELKRFQEEAAQREGIQTLIDSLGGAGLRGELADLEIAFATAAASGQLTDQMLLAMGQSAVKLRDDGLELSAGLNRVANEAQFAAEEIKRLEAEAANTAGIDKLADSLSDAGLGGEIDQLEQAFAKLAIEGRLNERTLQKVGEAATELEARGATLSAGLARTADEARKAGGAFAQLGNDLRAAFQDIPNMIVAALQGGGDVMASIGATFGGILGNALGDKLSQAVAGIGGKLGGILGSVMGPLGAIAGQFLGQGIAKAGGAIVSGLKSLFGGRSLTRNIEITVERDWGTSISKGLQKSIAGMRDVVGSDLAAILLNLAPIMEEAGGVAGLGFDVSAQKARDLFVMLETGKLTGQQVKGVLEDIFPQLVADLDLASVSGRKTFDELITLADKFGISVDAIEDFRIGADATQAEAALASLESAAERIQAGFQGAGQALAPLGVKAAQLITPFADLEEGTAAWADQIARTQAEFTNVGAIGIASLGALIQGGDSAVVAIGKLGGTIDQLREGTRKLGFESSAAIDQLLRFDSIISTNQAVFDSIQANADILKAFGDGGLLTQDIFQQLATDLRADFDQLTANGVAANDAILLMGPSLQTIFDQQQQFGFAVDESTQKLLDEAVAAGIVGASQEDAMTIAANAITLAAAAIDNLVVVLGGASVAAQDFGTTATGAVNQIEDAFRTQLPAGIQVTTDAWSTGAGIWQGNITATELLVEQLGQTLTGPLVTSTQVTSTAFSTMGEAGVAAGAQITSVLETASSAAAGIQSELGAIDFSGWAAEGIAAADAVEAAMSGVSLGKSPGGIKDIPIQLAGAGDAMKRFEEDTLTRLARISDATDRMNAGIAETKRRHEEAREAKERERRETGGGEELRKQIAVSDRRLVESGLEGEDLRQAQADAEKKLQREVGAGDARRTINRELGGEPEADRERRERDREDRAGDEGTRQVTNIFKIDVRTFDPEDMPRIIQEKVMPEVVEQLRGNVGDIRTDFRDAIGSEERGER